MVGQQAISKLFYAVLASAAELSGSSLYALGARCTVTRAGVDFSLGEWQKWKGLCGQPVVAVRPPRPRASQRKNLYVVLKGSILPLRLRLLRL